MGDKSELSRMEPVFENIRNFRSGIGNLKNAAAFINRCMMQLLENEIYEKGYFRYYSSDTTSVIEKSIVVKNIKDLCRVRKGTLDPSMIQSAGGKFPVYAATFLNPVGCISEELAKKECIIEATPESPVIVYSVIREDLSSNQAGNICDAWRIVRPICATKGMVILDNFSGEISERYLKYWLNIYSLEIRKTVQPSSLEILDLLIALPSHERQMAISTKLEALETAFKLLISCVKYSEGELQRSFHQLLHGSTIPFPLEAHERKLFSIAEEIQDIVNRSTRENVYRTIRAISTTRAEGGTDAAVAALTAAATSAAAASAASAAAAASAAVRPPAPATVKPPAVPASAMPAAAAASAAPAVPAAVKPPAVPAAVRPPAVPAAVKPPAVPAAAAPAVPAAVRPPAVPAAVRPPAVPAASPTEKDVANILSGLACIEKPVYVGGGEHQAKRPANQIIIIDNEVEAKTRAAKLAAAEAAENAAARAAVAASLLNLMTMPVEEISKLPLQFFESLPSICYSGFGPKILKAIPAEILARLSQEKIRYIDGTCLLALPASTIAAIPLATLKTLPLGLLVSFTAATFDALPKDVLKSLPKEVLETIPFATLSNMKKETLNEINSVRTATRSQQ